MDCVFFVVLTAEMAVSPEDCDGLMVTVVSGLRKSLPASREGIGPTKRNCITKHIWTRKRRSPAPMACELHSTADCLQFGQFGGSPCTHVARRAHEQHNKLLTLIRGPTRGVTVQKD